VELLSNVVFLRNSSSGEFLHNSVLGERKGTQLNCCGVQLNELRPLCGPPGRLEVKLADFGLARVYETSRMSGITMQGEIGGSIAFAPPEHLTNYRDAAPAGDLYSVAAMLYTLLTGELIYDFPDSIAKAVLMVLQTDPIPIQNYRSDLPKSLVDIIHKSLQRDPVNRFASATDMRVALQNLFEAP
jgi:serine/threonine protein kinase